ncbi:hypothetical protein FNH08_39210 [Streptomyces spongiae]|uniref:Uncharacterized protein n=1 Tax=Streptomyces spongiae TaxID=565072 RepID=A0A5N8XUA8_9ACTN|nr:hypothetical protein [Streptomyces spongiae]
MAIGGALLWRRKRRPLSDEAQEPAPEPGSRTRARPTTMAR